MKRPTHLLLKGFMATGLVCVSFGQDSTGTQDQPIIVATLHPLFTDMVEQIGDKNVKVINLLKSNGNLHGFEPSPQDVAGLSQAKILFASGKNMEPYLSKLKESLGKDTKVVELGATIPDVPVSDSLGDDHEHGPNCSCSHGPSDPHWWHTPSNMKRAGRVVNKELATVKPSASADFQAKLKAWNDKMDELDTWAKKEMSTIPADKRVIVTEIGRAHV